MNFHFTEMVYKREVALKKIEGLAEPFITHLFKVMLFQKAQEYNHWVFDEMYNKQLVKMFYDYSFLTKGKRVKREDYYKILFKDPLEFNDQNNFIKGKIRVTILSNDEIAPKFYHNSLTNENLETIFNHIKTFIIECIDRNSQELMSKSEFNSLLQKYITNLTF